MKKNIRFVITMLSLMLLMILSVGCSKEEAPGDVVKKAFHGVISRNFDELVSTVYFPDSLSEEDVEIESLNAKRFFELLMRHIDENGDSLSKTNLLKKVQITKEQVKGDMAIVGYETSTAGGFIENGNMILRRNKEGEWKIPNIQNLIPSAEFTKEGKD